MNRNFLTLIDNILESKEFDLKSLARSVSADPAIFYVNQDLSRCKLFGQDLSGMDLTGTNISPDQLDQFTKIDAEFDPRFRFQGEYISLNLSRELVSLVYSFSDSVGYKYKAWAFKALIERGLNASYQSTGKNVLRVIERSEAYKFVLEPGVRSRRFHLQIYRPIQERAHRWASDRGEESMNKSYSTLILIGIISSGLRGIAKKDFGNIPPLALFDTSRDHFRKL